MVFGEGEKPEGELLVQFVDIIPNLSDLEQFARIMVIPVKRDVHLLHVSRGSFGRLRQTDEGGQSRPHVLLLHLFPRDDYAQWREASFGARLFHV